MKLLKSLTPAKPKQIKVLLVFCIVSFIITGCLPFANKRLNRAEVDDLLAHHQYGVALSELDRTVNSDSKSGAIRKHVLNEAKNYEKEQIKKSHKLATKKQLYSAFKTLEDALQNFPQSTELKEKLASLTDRRDALIQKKLGQLALDYAHYLKKALAAHQQIDKWKIDSQQLSQQSTEIYNEAENLAKHLIEIAEAKQSMRHSKTKNIAQHYNTAMPLSDAEPIKTAYSAFVNSKKAKARHKKQILAKKNQTHQQANQLKNLIRDIKHSIKQKDFIKAKKMLNNTKKFPVDRKLKKLKALYQSTLSKEVLESYKKGVKHYSAEQYQSASESWKKTLTLDPKHEMARKNLRRVSRILKKIRQLQQKG